MRMYIVLSLTSWSLLGTGVEVGLKPSFIDYDLKLSFIDYDSLSLSSRVVLLLQH